MINDLMGMFGNAQSEMEDTKKKLDTIIVNSEVQGGLIKVSANANKKITDINISQELIDEKDKEAIEDMLLSVINKAIQKAEEVHKNEMQKIMSDMMPAFGDLMK